MRAVAMSVRLSSMQFSLFSLENTVKAAINCFWMAEEVSNSFSQTLN
jgi:hypothetical protein